MTLQCFFRLGYGRRVLKTLPVLYHPKQQRCSSSVTGQVLVSKSKNIYENLALEDWLYENGDLDSTSTLLLWHNNPAVVFGRHQNPWVECNLASAQTNGVDVVRRKSGGGTVFHDLGNLNCSFLKRRELYNRRANLDLVVDAVKKHWDVNLSINDKEDIIIDDLYKISGTASKLGGKRTYHHFTLLMDVNQDLLLEVLQSSVCGISTNATPSRPSQVSCLKTAIPNVDFQTMVNVVSTHFLQSSDSKDAGIQLIEPMDESRFPGIRKHLQELKSWEWIYGKTPTFSIKQTFKNTDSITSSEQVLEVDVGIKKGLVDKVDLELSSPNMVDPRAIEMLKIGLLDTRLSRNDLIGCLSQVKMEWISNDLYDVKTRQSLDWLILSMLDTLNVWHSPSRRKPSQKSNMFEVYQKYK